MRGPEYRYTEKRSDALIKFDYKKAREQGLKGSDLEHVRSLGFEVLNLERFPKSYYALFEVKEYSNKKLSLPDYIERLDNFWEFEKQYPL